MNKLSTGNLYVNKENQLLFLPPLLGTWTELDCHTHDSYATEEVSGVCTDWGVEKLSD